MPSRKLLRHACLIAPLAFLLAAQADDLHIKKSITVGGNFVSSTETSIKGARQRDVTNNRITLTQCDLKRTVTINDQLQTYMIQKDPVEDKTGEKDAAGKKGADATQGGTIVVTTTVTDTGERKTIYGLPARHLKATVTQEPSADACNKTGHSFEMDGWYTDAVKDLASCTAFHAPVQQASGCNDKVVQRHRGSGKPGYPLAETVTFQNADGSRVQMGIQASEISKLTLEPALFEIPQGYRAVSSEAELNGLPAPQAMAPQGQPNMQAMMQQGMVNPAAQGATWNQQPQQPAQYASANTQGMPQQAYGGSTNPSAAQNMAMGQMQQQMAQHGAMNPMAAMGGNPMAMMQQMMGGGGGMQGMGQQPGPAAAPVAAPQQLGPKMPGRIRIGVAPPDAQVGQGTNTGGDYSTPIRNSMVLLMSGPAVEIAALDSRIPIQLQAEAQQKQCDFVLFSAVSVKHGSGGGFGKFMKMGSMASSMTPIGMMGKGMGGAVAAQAASAAASAAAMSAQQQAMNQLAGFNQQIKSKDDVTVQYSLVQTGQTTPRIQSQLQGKAKSDGEDVLTPLLTQTANAVLTEATKK